MVRDVVRSAIQGFSVLKPSPQAVPSPPLPQLLTVADVAIALRTSAKAIYSMVERGQIRGIVRIGRRVLFRRDLLLLWLEEQSGAPSPEGDRR